MGTVSDMAKKKSKVAFRVDINKIYRFGQNLRGSLRGTARFLEKVSLKYDGMRTPVS